MVMLKARQTSIQEVEKIRQKDLPPRGTITSTGNVRDFTSRNPGKRAQTILDPETTNLALMRFAEPRPNSPIKGPIIVVDRNIVAGKRTHIYPSEKHLRDPVIGHTPTGKRVFAVNKEGVPICYARRQGTEGKGIDGDNIRCQSVFTLHNGRCKKHGGKARRGAEHWNSGSLRTSSAVPKSMQLDMRRAETDDKLLESQDEIRFIDVQIAEEKRKLNFTLDSSPERALHFKILELEKQLREGKAPTKICEEIVDIWNHGKNRRTALGKVNELILLRDKLVRTMHSREKDLKLMLRGEEAISLVIALSSTVKTTLQKLWDQIDKRFILVERNKLSKESFEYIAATNAICEGGVPNRIKAFVDSCIRTGLDKATQGRPASDIDEDVEDVEFEEG